MRILYGALIVVAVLVVFNKLPFPGSKPAPAPTASKPAATASVTPAAAPAAAPATTPAKAASAAAPAPAAAPAAAPAPVVRYVATRDCVRSMFGSVNCTELTTVAR